MKWDQYDHIYRTKYIFLQAESTQQNTMPNEVLYVHCMC